MPAPSWIPERRIWIGVLRPPAVRVGVLESLLVLVVGTALALFRLGGASLRGVLWAEDGQTFLTQAYDHGLSEVLFQPVRGYALTLPRVVTWAVTKLPIETQGVAICLAACVIQASLAVLAYHVVAAHTPPHGPSVGATGLARVAPGLVALAVVAVPVGPEVVANLANLQWFLLFTGCLVAFWTPTRLSGVLVLMLLLLVVTTTSPFGAATVLLAGIAWLLARSWWSFAVLAAGILGLVCQLLVMTRPSPGAAVVYSTVRPRLLVRGYLQRVLADGVFGIERHFPSRGDSSMVVLIALGLVLGTALVLLLVSRPAALAVPTVLVTLSVACFCALMVVSGLTQVKVLASARYYVPPVLFLLTALAIMVGRVLGTERRSDLLTVASRAMALLLAGAVVYGTASSWNTSALSYDRAATPGWAEQIPAARKVCQTGDGIPNVRVPIAPPRWGVVVPCDLLLPRPVSPPRP